MWESGSLLARIHADGASVGIRKRWIGSFSGAVVGMGRPTDVTDGEADGPARGYEKKKGASKEGRTSLPPEEGYSRQTEIEWERAGGRMKGGKGLTSKTKTKALLRVVKLFKRRQPLRVLTS